MSTDEYVWKITTAIAVENLVIRMEGSAPEESPAALLSTIEAIGASLRTAGASDLLEVQQEVKGLNLAPLKNLPIRKQTDGSPATQGKAGSQVAPLAKAVLPAPGTTVRVTAQNGRDSELEIAVADGGKDIVIGANSAFFFSSDGGQTWGNSMNVGSSDPSVSWGPSGGPQGTFYAANINTPSTGFWTSTDGGANFVGPTAAYTCGQNGDPACGGTFPDQEHIVADRFNQTAGGDQIYDVWRTLVGAKTWGIVCSQDSGATWSANGQFFAGDLPKVSVGQDGTVYVAYHPDNDDNILVRTFTSCENGLTNLGASLVVANPAGVACPTPGLDRCNRRNSLASPLVAVDDTDPNHVYIAYAANTFPGNGGGWFGNCTNQNLCNEDIVVQDSPDKGVSWSAPLVISSGVTARRYMPWACAQGGEVHVAWYDRSAASPGGTTVSNNSLTDFFRSSAFLNAAGDLTKGTEFQINEIGSTDAECEAGAATGSNASWPSAVDRTGDSESCSLQPQRGGTCCVNAEAPGGLGTFCTPGTPSPSSMTRCDFNQDVCPAGEVCAIRRGSPKYGDYNGVACAEGRFYTTWASATSPPSMAVPSTNIDTFFASDLVCCVPRIQVPAPVNFGASCVADGAPTATLDVCNTGKEDLVVGLITSSNPNFTVIDPVGGLPVTISPDFCFPFEVTFDNSTGMQSGTLTINSNDPVDPAFQVPVTGTIGEGEIVTIFDEAFGNVCLGDTSTQELRIQNSGACDLTVSNITSSNGEFDLATVMSFPLTIAPGGEITAPIEFAPVGDTTNESSTISISHDGGNTASPKQITANGTSEDAVITSFLADAGAFGDVCAGDIRDLDLTINNDGSCPLEIDSVMIALGANAQVGDFDDPAGVAGTIVEPGNSVLFPIRFSPSAFDNEPPLTRAADVNVASHTENAASSLPTDTTGILGVVPPPDINLAIANSGDFGAVCNMDQSDLDLTLFNQGKCDLAISGIDLVPGAGSFELPADLQLPLVLSPDADFTVPVRFAPEVCFDTPEMSMVKVTSDDPDEMMLNVDISGVAPCPNLVIDPENLTDIFSFPSTVVDTTGTLGCFSERGLNLRNNSECPLTISSISSAGADFLVTDPTVFPILLPGGEETLGVTVRFLPQADANPLVPSEVTGLLTVASDDPDGNGLADLCGESVAQSGVRVLVTDVSTGLPVPVVGVDRLGLTSKGKNTPSPVNITLTDANPIGGNVCGNPVQYHLNYEALAATATTGSNPNSSYEAKAREGNLQDRQSFGLGQCEFLEFQLQLTGNSGDDPPFCEPGLFAKGDACMEDSECCSGKCTGKPGLKTCK